MKKLLLSVLAVVTIFSLAGCGKKESTEGTNKVSEIETSTNTSVSAQESTEAESVKEIEEAVEKLPEETISEYQESLKETEVTTENNKITFKQSDVLTAVYYHDGEKITGYEAYVEYDSVENAQIAKAEALADEDANDIESVTVEGNKLHVVFKESAYEDTSLEDIKQAAALVQALQGIE